MKRAVKRILSFFTDAWSLAEGLSVTLRYALKKPSTLQYPKKKRPLPTGVKGPIRFVYFEETKSHDCIACNLCVKICPSYCIEVKGGKTPEGKRRPHLFKLDYGTCSLCSLCIEVCPTRTLEHSDDVEWAGLNRTNFLMDFLKDTTDYRKKLDLGPVAPAESQSIPPVEWAKPLPPKPKPPDEKTSQAQPENPQ